MNDASCWNKLLILYPQYQDHMKYFIFQPYSIANSSDKKNFTEHLNMVFSIWIWRNFGATTIHTLPKYTINVVLFLKPQMGQSHKIQGLNNKPLSAKTYQIHIS